MKCVARLVGCAVVLGLIGCAHRDLTVARKPVAEEFVGTSPGSVLVREFLGGLTTNAPCDSVTWRLTLSTNHRPELPHTFSLSALYRVPTRSNPNRSEDGPSVKRHGTWEVVKGTKSSPEKVVYRFHAAETDRSLSFVKVGEHLLHLLNPDESLAIGNGGFSYTLNRAEQAEKPGDNVLAMSAPSMSYKISPLATGATVYAVFEGRSPCHGISTELKMPQHAGCIKAKWRVTLNQNAETSAPTTCKVEGSLFREAAREGTWSVTRGAIIDLNAIVYQLNPTESQPAVLLLKGDENVLFFLNQNRAPLIGHSEFSYTLNRVVANDPRSAGQ